MKDVAGRPSWEVHFDEKGGRSKGDTAATIVTQVREQGVTDLIVFSHGWNNDEKSARKLYTAMFPLIGAQARAHAPALAAGLGYLGLFWPSTWFADDEDEDARPAARRGDAQAVTGGAAAAAPPLGARTAAMTGAQVVAAVAGAFPGSAKADLDRLGTLIDEGVKAQRAGEPPEKQEARLAKAAALVHKIGASGGPTNVEDRGEQAALAKLDGPEARRRYRILSDTVGGGPSGGDAQFGLGDLAKAWHGLKEATRVASFFQMKGRAGVVGRKGLGPLLVALAKDAPGVRVHLVGHSFGARLVSFSLTAVGGAAASPVHSLVLVQGAFSHWSFADPQPWDHPGALHTFADRVKGPLVATFSEHDRAVGEWYPAASVLNGEDAQFAFSERWGGLGADGFQKVPRADPAVQMAAAGAAYPLTAGGFCSVDGSRVIASTRSKFSGAHSDIRHPEVAWTIAAAAQAGAGV